MHATSYNEMSRVLFDCLAYAFTQPMAVLDVGSRRVQPKAHTYRRLMPAAWTYVGCDVEPGDNVDLVQLSEYRIRQEAGLYDVVISGQCLEHVRKPWLLAAEMARMLKPGGWAFWTAPWTWGFHPHPIDCWRILPDGMKALIEEAGLLCHRAYRVEKDCWGIGIKPMDGGWDGPREPEASRGDTRGSLSQTGSRCVPGTGGPDGACQARRNSANEPYGQACQPGAANTQRDPAPAPFFPFEGLP